MAADALLGFKTSTLTKASGGITTTTFGAGTTLAAADAPLNITPQVQLRENGLFVKVMIQATSITGSGSATFAVSLHGSKVVGSGYSVLHSTPADMVYLTCPGTGGVLSGKTNFTVYLPIAAPAGFTDSTNTVQDLYTFFQVKITETFATVTGTGYTAKVQIVSGKDGGIL